MSVYYRYNRCRAESDGPNYRSVSAGEYPNVTYFNAHNYNYGTLYGYVDGNYFVTC